MDVTISFHFIYPSGTRTRPMTSDYTDLFVLPFYKSNSHANFSNLRPVLFVFSIVPCIYRDFFYLFCLSICLCLSLTQRKLSSSPVSPMSPVTIMSFDVNLCHFCHLYLFFPWFHGIIYKDFRRTLSTDLWERRLSYDKPGSDPPVH